MRPLQILFLIMVTMLSTLIADAAGTPPTKLDDSPFWAGNPDAETFTRVMNERLDLARKALDRLGSFKGQRTIENTLPGYDEILQHLDVVASQASLMEAVHPDAKLREAAEKATQRASAFFTELSLNKAAYDALAALDLSKADPETKYFVERDLRDFRLAGVDKDEAVRKRVKELRDELVIIGQEFDKN